MGKFVVTLTGTQARFKLVAGNGETIGVSEVYSGKDACLGGIESVRNNAAKAAIEDQTTGEAKTHPKFELYTDKAGEFRFRLKASNGEIILSSEGYSTKSGCKNGIESVIKNAADARVEGL